MAKATIKAAGRPASKPAAKRNIATLGPISDAIKKVAAAKRAKADEEDQGFTVVFGLERDTKGALKYEELNAKGRPVQLLDPGTKIGSLYIRKSAFDDLEPRRIRVTVEVIG